MPDRADLKCLTKQQIDSLKNTSVILVREEYKVTYRDLKSYEESHLVDGNCGVVLTGQPVMVRTPSCSLSGKSNINLTKKFFTLNSSYNTIFQFDLKRLRDNYNL